MTIINSDESLSRFIGELREDYFKHRYLEVKVKVGTKRSLNQNAISHVWYEQIARELREYDSLGWKCYSKYTIGVPLLYASDEEFAAFWQNNIRMSFTYEQKIEMMKFMPVTSLMNKETLSKYLEAMIDHFSKRGVMLQFPNE